MRIQRVIDLSIAVDEHTQVYPGDPVVELHSATRIETDGFNVLSVALGIPHWDPCRCALSLRS